MLLNIIHPHMYKGTGDTLVLGPIEQFAERDKRVSEFISTALNGGVDVLMHKNDSGDMMKSIVEEMVLYRDSHFKILFDSRVNICTTTQWGMPLPDLRPETFSQDVWDRAIEIYDSRKSLYEKVRGHTKTMFIGGVLENCVANAMGYFQDEFGFAGKDIFYVPELCVSIDSVQLGLVDVKFKERGFSELTTEQALNLMKRK